MPDSNAYAKLAEGFDFLAEGCRLLAAGKAQAKSTTAREPDAPINIGQLHAAMTAKRSEGKINQIRELLLKYNAGRLSELKAEDYARFLEEVETL